jgi:hypothetical protein
MEGETSKLQQEQLPEETQEALDCFRHTEGIPLKPWDRELLRSLVLNRTRGHLTIIINGEKSRQIDIDPTKTSLQVSEEISDALFSLYSSMLFARADNMRRKDDMKEDYVITFKEVSLQ